MMKSDPGIRPDSLSKLTRSDGLQSDQGLVTDLIKRSVPEGCPGHEEKKQKKHGQEVV